MVIVSYISITTLNVNGLNLQTKRYTGWADKNMCIYAFPLMTSLWLIPQIVCYYFLIFSLIMFPLWLAIVIIFYFLSYYWLWKLINIFYSCDYATITHLIPLYHDWLNNRKIIKFYVTKNILIEKLPVITF